MPRARGAVLVVKSSEGTPVRIDKKRPNNPSLFSFTGRDKPRWFLGVLWMRRRDSAGVCSRAAQIHRSPHQKMIPGTALRHCGFGVSGAVVARFCLLLSVVKKLVFSVEW